MLHVSNLTRNVKADHLKVMAMVMATVMVAVGGDFTPRDRDRSYQHFAWCAAPCTLTFFVEVCLVGVFFAFCSLVGHLSEFQFVYMCYYPPTSAVV